MLALAQQVVSPLPSAFAPVAIGFFGLGTGYFVWGGQALFKFPRTSPEIEKSMGLWGIWMPGFMQFLTGIILLIGLTWFPVFRNDAGLYMAALAFTAYGVHWFVMGYRRFIGADPLPDAWMALAFLIISILGLAVFAEARAWPLVILFAGLSLIYLTEAPTRFGIFAGHQLIGFWQFITGLWLMYLTYGTVFNLVFHSHWWV
ncbi:MAG: hypothetical protein ACTHN5_18445 [Phycisphaerae bacterium]